MVDQKFFQNNVELKSKDDTGNFLIYHTLIVKIQQDIALMIMQKLLVWMVFLISRKYKTRSIRKFKN